MDVSDLLSREPHIHDPDSDVSVPMYCTPHNFSEWRDDSARAAVYAKLGLRLPAFDSDPDLTLQQVTLDTAHST